MKRNICLILLLCMAMCGFAEQNRHVNLNRAMQRLWREGKHFEALDSAVTLLSLNNDNLPAKAFVRQHWDEAMNETQNRLAVLYESENLAQLEERVELYRVMDEIYDRLFTVQLPLQGNGWQWMPPSSYYSGHYDDARIEAFRVAMKQAEQAARSYDVEMMKDCYEMAFHKFLLTEGERNSFLPNLLAKETARLRDLVNAQHLHKAIFAYELAGYLLTLKAGDDELLNLQTQARQTIVNEYLKMAEVALQQGDTIRSNDLKLSAEDWVE